ncbi:hypothetical protein SK224_12235 [Microbacterium sp. BG28]|uniref:hypothetical protein n=1 Tax=Microbacterium sp. BG28 TaxID=3097356 RepID=UPI002A5AD6BB|nr:hypothetical protein [Microbacterium sp. BG28]MDY0829892.1 hypothetical protein [Microbacterium sp. BG28]
MSEWEQRLRNLAEGPEWQMPNLSAIGPALSSLTTLMNRVASETGFTGQTERDAVDQMQKAKADIEELRRYVQQDLPNSIADANRRREEAQRHLDALDSGSLSADAQQTIRNAAAGATIVFPGFSVIAGEGAIAAANWFLGSQREAQAKSAVEAVSNGLDQDAGAFPTLPEMENVYGSIPNIPDDLRDTNIDTGGPSAPSFQNYPDYNTPIGVPPGQSGVIRPNPDGGDPQWWSGGPEDRPTGTRPIAWVDALPAPGVIVHPDGPVDGGVGQYPGGGLGTMPGGGSGGSGLGGVGSGGAGSGGLSSGFMAGAGGAAALGGLGKAAAAGGLGGLRGAGGLGGAGLAARGGAGGLGGGLTANAGGGAGGGLLGKGGVGGAGAGAGAAGEAAGGSRGATGMMGGGGAGAGAGGGGRSDKKGRGLGGPIAPSIEDDAEFGPRSEGAGAGGRD